MTQSIKELKIFCCYAHEDREWQEKLERYLTHPKRQYRFSTWFDGLIKPGDEWAKVIEEYLSSADLIFLLISPDFMASDNCNQAMQRALERHVRKEARVIPILLRPTYVEGAPFSHIQMLPTNNLPLTLWTNIDEAFQDIIFGLGKIVQDRQALEDIAERWMVIGNTFFSAGQYEEAIAYYERASRSVSISDNLALAYANKGFALAELHRFGEALVDLDKAIGLDPSLAIAHTNRGAVLTQLKRYDEALQALDEAIRLDPGLAIAYGNKGNTLTELKRYEEALHFLEESTRLDPKLAISYSNKGFILTQLKRYDEALLALDRAISLKPNFVVPYLNKGSALIALQKYDETLLVSEQAIHLDSNSALAYMNKGFALTGLQRYGEALLALEQASRLDPGYRMAYNMLLRFMSSGGDNALSVLGF
jgi:tetratricopeptide (TPR) repeat protein